MKCDERSVSRFSFGCGHGEDYHEYSDSTVITKKKNVKLYLSWVLRRGDIVRYALTVQTHTDYHY